MIRVINGIEYILMDEQEKDTCVGCAFNDGTEDGDCEYPVSNNYEHNTECFELNKVYKEIN